MSIYPASIDDNDPQVLYSSGWVLITSDPPWTGTIHSTSQVGAFARVRFTGSRIAVVCTIPTGDGHSTMSMASFSIDNGPAIQVAVVATPAVQYQYEFWNSDPLPMGSHLLVITNTGNEDYFRLDRIDYDPTNGNAPAASLPSPVTSTAAIPSAAAVSPSAITVIVNSLSSATVSSTGLLGSKSSVNSLSSTLGASTATTSTLSSGIHSDPTSASANNPAVTGSHTSNSSTVAIISGVLGGLLFLTLLIAPIIFCRRRKKRSIYSQAREKLHHPLQSSNPTIPRPFTLNAYTDDSPSAKLPSASPVSSNHKQISTIFRDSSMDAAHSSSSSPLVTYSDSDPTMMPQTPLVLHIGRHQVPPEKWQGGPTGSRTIGNPPNAASKIAFLDSPPAYSGFS